METDRLYLIPGNSKRDAKAFLEMLRNDGDFRLFCGVEPTESRVLQYSDYFEKEGNCLFAIFTKENLDEFIGYVGIGVCGGRYEVEFYISKNNRNKGYCTEALKKICQCAFSEGLSMDNKIFKIDKLYATTIRDNISTIRVLRKCGFIRTQEEVMLFNLMVDSEDGSTFQNEIDDFVLEKEKLLYG